jgi:hypothetical protein
MERNLRSLRITAIVALGAIVIACTLAVFRYPTDFTIGRDRFGNMWFLLLMISPLPVLAWTVLRTRSPAAVYFTSIAVAVLLLAVVVWWIEGGEMMIYGFGLAPFTFWALCVLNFYLTSLFSTDAT